MTRIQLSVPRFGGWIFGAFIGLALLTMISGAGVSWFTQRDVTATVSRAERVCTPGSEGGIDCRYLVFTDETTFENRDDLWVGKFNSSDLHGRIRDGGTYRFTISGWRVPFFSWYPNIVTLAPAGPPNS